MTTPTFGISFERINDEAGPSVSADMSVAGLVVTAPAADATKFPLNMPVLIFSGDSAAVNLLGATGTGKDAVELLDAQLGDLQGSAKIVIVRVTEGADNAATIANIVGSESAGTGIWALLKAGPILGIVPRLIACPGYTSQTTTDGGQTLANPVCAALPAVLNKLLGVAIIDGPASTDQAFTDWVETMSSERLIPVETAIKVGVNAVVKPASPAVLGIAIRRDYEKDGKPSGSWANQPIYGIVGPNRPIAFSLTDGATEGQDILSKHGGVILRGEAGVETAIASGGFIYVGTDTLSEDPLWQFYHEVRIRDYIHLTFLRTLRYYLGRFSLNGTTLQMVYNAMRSFLRDLQAAGHILGSKVDIPTDVNSAEELRTGKVTILFRAEEPPVLRHLHIQSGRYLTALDAMISDLQAQIAQVI